MFFQKKEFGSKVEWLLVGLGNPGLEYENTRHNAGFMAIDTLAKKYRGNLNKMKWRANWGDCEIAGHKCLLVKPQTYMNNSGEAVRDIAGFYKVDPAHTLLFFDDISLDVGVMRIRRKGSDGGHNGMKSIALLCNSQDFPRIKIGVGHKPHPDYDLADWVLSKFKPEEAEPLGAAIDRAVQAAALIVDGQMDQAMNQFSR